MHPFSESQGWSVGECVSEAEVVSDCAVGLKPHPTPLLCSPRLPDSSLAGEGGGYRDFPLLLAFLLQDLQIILLK